MNNDQTIYKLQPHYRLKIVQGIDAGKQFSLYRGFQYIIGRSQTCEISIDAKNIHASGKHAMLTVEAKGLILENLNKNNTTLVLGNPIDKVSLKPGGQFQIDATVFVVEGNGTSGHQKKSRNFKMLIAAALLMLLFIIFTSYSMRTKSDIASPAINKPNHLVADNPDSRKGEKPKAPFPAVTATTTTAQSESESSPDNLTADRDKAAEHYRNGVFFYDAGNMGKAIDEWDHALTLDRENANARKRLLKAEGELEELIDKHYQNALLHKKYMRYSEAVKEFIIVSEMSRNKEDERYVNSLKEIKELEGR